MPSFSARCAASTAPPRCDGLSGRTNQYPSTRYLSSFVTRNRAASFSNMAQENMQIDNIQQENMDQENKEQEEKIEEEEKDLTLKFIEAVKKHKCIWDMQSEEYYNKRMYRAAWRSLLPPKENPPLEQELTNEQKDELKKKSKCKLLYLHDKSYFPFLDVIKTILL